MHPVFDYTDADLSLATDEAEAALITAAQAGDPAAKERLIAAYGPVIRAAVRRYGQSSVDSGLTERRSLDDLQQAALLGALEAIAAHDVEVYPRLGQRMVHHLNRVLAEENTTAFAVPGRTLTRFYGIMRAADGDPVAAEEIAPEFKMSRATFRVLRQLVDARSLDEQTGDEAPALDGARPLYAPEPVTDADDRVLVDLAFAAMADDEARVCELHYGFTEYEPVPDAEIAHRLGTSRPTVQRIRARGLDKARRALAAAEEV
jgi:RNA polymerase sigma factor (sigma-70 family)